MAIQTTAPCYAAPLASLKFQLYGKSASVYPSILGSTRKSRRRKLGYLVT